jgi:drug/metabolite transporter (DMT)-like permease
VKEVGASRAAVIAGAGPLVAVTIAFTILGEPVEAALVVGAVLIVAGVIALAGERGRPEHLRFVGLLLAFGSTVFFATRDNIVRWLAEDTPVDPQLAAAATLVSGSAVMVAYLLFLRGRRAPADVLRAFRPFALPGVFWGVSYAAIFEAFYRGRVSVVSPLIATEALFGVLLAAVIIGKSELIGRHVIVAAGLIVCGGVLIGAFQ